MALAGCMPPLAPGDRRMPIDAFCAVEPGSAACGGDIEGAHVLAVGSDAAGGFVHLAMGDPAVRHAAAVARYDARVRTLQAPEAARDLTDERGLAAPDVLHGRVSLHACGDPPTDAIDDGLGGCKTVFGIDDRVVVTDARSTYPFTKHVTFTLGTGLGTAAPVNVCSGTFLDADHVLTAAHCVYDTGTNAWLWAGGPGADPGDRPTPLGVDEGMGYVCRSGWMEDPDQFEAHCEFVDVRYVDDAYVRARNDTSVRAVKRDYALLKLRRDHHPQGLGAGAWMAISRIRSGAIYQEKTAVVHGYPAVHPPGGDWNWTSRRWVIEDEAWEVWGARQYRATGAVDRPSTRSLLRSKYDCSPGMSGAAIFYFTDDAIDYRGQPHYIIGVHAADEADNDGSTGDDHCVGPTARQFRDWAMDLLP